ncbi:fimbria/pilus periplasmic chaperone [Photobacterium sp. SDRW27]|uniref:fimbria/pilus periplasmic chaperone n=1 Tax=Photobacterium obscurum TaxID=2829490 RepID=UPI002243549A|nr:fimbria/pilus periplasmic chaperone [Photobacterium obscurum]MCW8327209.1 fimbria/pilus periplasmic chaperone [Photobacterium obscurum]
MKKVVNIFIIFFFAILSINGYALEIGPLVHEITTESKSNRTKITLRNNSSSYQLIDASVSRLVFEGADYDFNPATGNDLLVFPPAFKLEPGDSQSVMVIWGGAAQLSESLSYSIKFSAINEIDPSKKGAIGIEIHYNVIVHVSSSLQAADIAQVPIRGSKAADGLLFAVENRGSKYSKLSNFDLLLKNSRTNQDHHIPSQTVISEGFDIFIPANQTVDITIPYSSLPTLDIDQIILVEKVYE